jgi:hypothetical protein
MQLMQSNNPQLLQMIASPENLPLLYEALGLTELVVPGEDSRNKQYDEIKELLNSEPLILPLDEEAIITAIQMGQEPQPLEEPSVEIGEFDNDSIELEICIKWINSEAGRQMKLDNPLGYKNVLLHARAHKMAIQMKAMEQLMQAGGPMGGGAAPVESAKQTDQEAPIMGDLNVQTSA